MCYSELCFVLALLKVFSIFRSFTLFITCGDLLEEMLACVGSGLLYEDRRLYNARLLSYLLGIFYSVHLVQFMNNLHVVTLDEF